MKQVIPLVMIAVFFVACKKDIDTTSSTNQVSLREPGISARLLSDATKFAKRNNYKFITDKDTLGFTQTKVAPLPNDTARYREVSDSLADEIFYNVYVKLILRLPEFPSSYTGYIDPYKDYIVFSSDFRKYYYDPAKDIYYSTYNQHFAAPNGRNPFTFTTIFTDTTAGIVRELGRLRRVYITKYMSPY